MSGINASATPGGNAIADLRTVYAYTPDGTNGEGTYQGSSWPYATTDRDISELVVDFVATGDEVATFTKNSDNQILINDQPAYQYTGDNSDSAATGNAVGGVWYLFSPDGSTLEPTPAPTPQTKRKRRSVTKFGAIAEPIQPII